MKKKITFTLIALLLMYPAFSQLSDQEIDQKAEKIHKKYLTVDSHTDAPLQLTVKGFDIAETHDPGRDHSTVDFPRMKAGGLDAAFFAVFVSQGKRTPEGNAKAKAKADLLFDTLYSVINRYPDLAEMAFTPADAYQLKKHGKRAIFIGIENGYPIGNELSLIQSYYSRGARYITLCHTRNNDICDSSTDSVGFDGLSVFGKNVVLFMNKVGMMVDISHASDKSFYDVISLSKAPVIASHSCARALCDNKRNLDDDMLRALAKNGGVIQMCILSDYVKKPDPNPARDSARTLLIKKFDNFDGLPEDQKEILRNEWNVLEQKFPRKLATVSDVVDHIDHIVKVAGIDHVGIGTDFDGGGGVEGCRDVSQMKNITKELIRRGYSAKDIGKIWGGNLMRVMKKVKRVSKRLNPACNC